MRMTICLGLPVRKSTVVCMFRLIRHQAVIHQFAREVLAECGKMILGSDSHTRYGALGTMAMGEGGPELVKQHLNKTYDLKKPEVIGIYLDGEPAKGVGPQDVALAIIGLISLILT